MLVNETKVRENRLRRAANRQGWILRKCRRRDQQAVDFGRYWLIDMQHNMVVSGGQFGMDLEEVEEILS